MGRRNHLRLAGLYWRMESAGLCVYCGVKATCLDHFVPVSVSSALIEVKTVDAKARILLPSCSECNLLAGSKLFKTFGAKRRFIKNCIKARYYKILAMPSWKPEELEDLGWTLKTKIEQDMKLQTLIRQRLEFVIIVKSHSKQIEAGKSSVREPAARPFISKKLKTLARHGEKDSERLHKEVLSLMFGS